MRQKLQQIDIDSRGRGLHDLTADVVRFCAASGIDTGLLTVFVRHTSASLLIQENADPLVLQDLETLFARLAPDGDPAFRHRSEGPDDMAAHARCALTQTQLAVPVADGRPLLGTWQGIFLWEHRHEGMRRRVALHLLGE